MKIKVSASFTLVLTLAVSASAQTHEYANEDNGKDWNKMDHDDKVFYMDGFNNGYWYGVQLDHGEVPENNLTIGQQVVAIDQCYHDKRNLKLPIMACFAFAVGQSNGVAPDKLEGMLEKLRAKHQ